MDPRFLIRGDVVKVSGEDNFLGISSHARHPTSWGPPWTSSPNQSTALNSTVPVLCPAPTTHARSLQGVHVSFAPTIPTISHSVLVILVTAIPVVARGPLFEGRENG